MKFKHRNKTFNIEGVSQDDHIYRQIVKNNSFYEKDLLEYMYTILNFQGKKRKTLAIDVGANIGNHSIFFRSFLSDYLIAIEPNYNILPILHKNLSHNIDSFTIYECGVGEKKGMATINLPKGSNNNIGMAKLSFDTNGNAIKVSTIDIIINKWQEDKGGNFDLSVIKIDVEGMELAVLKGAEKTIIKHKPHIFAEAATPEEYFKLNDYLKRQGYKKLSRWAATPVYHFAFKPTLLLILKINIYRIFNEIRCIKACLARRLF